MLCPYGEEDVEAREIDSHELVIRDFETVAIE
jgi:hypothetical protein